MGVSTFREIREEIMSCARCGNREKVIGRGSLSPVILFIGLNPGVEEVRVGAPFVGPSGKLLDEWVKHWNLPNNAIAITNIVKCHTPNEAGVTGEMLQNCKEYLDRQIDYLKPDMIISLGRLASEALKGSSVNITKDIGPYEYKGVPLYTLPHPSYYLRGGGDWTGTINKFIPTYTPIHVHSEYSVMDGIGSVESRVKAAAEMGFRSLALTDHGTLSGLYDFQLNCKKYKIKPIFGCEFYVTDTLNRGNGDRYHLVLLAKDNIGLRNLFKLNHIAHENFYYKPRVTIDLISDYSEGLIASTACVGGVISRRIINSDFDIARDTLSDLKAIFGDDLYVEVQPHKFEEQVMVNPKLIEYADEYDVEVVIGTDVHYNNRGDKFIYDVVKAILFNKKVGEGSIEGDTYHLMRPDELFYAGAEANIPPEVMRRAMINTHRIARECNAKIEFHSSVYPRFRREWLDW